MQITDYSFILSIPPDADITVKHPTDNKQFIFAEETNYHTHAHAHTCMPKQFSKM